MRASRTLGVEGRLKNSCKSAHRGCLEEECCILFIIFLIANPGGEESRLFEYLGWEIF